MKLASDQSAVVADQTKLLYSLVLRGGAWVRGYSWTQLKPLDYPLWFEGDALWCSSLLCL